MMQHDLNTFRAALAQGILPALRYLNARTPHRFTGIFRFDEQTLENIYLVDREAAYAEPWPSFPVRESYCSFVQGTGDPFVIGDAPDDRRADGHPAQHRVISYCGVPIRLADGLLLASLCHFDYKPIPFSSLDLEFLIEVAPLLAEALVPVMKSNDAL